MFIKKLVTFRLQSQQLLSSNQKIRNNNNIVFIGDRTDSLTNFSTNICAMASSQRQLSLHATNNLVASIWYGKFPSHETLASKYVKLNPLCLDGTQDLLIKFERGRSGLLSIQISYNYFSKLWVDFAKILVPEDAYTMVREMDELIATLPDTALKPPATTNMDDGSVPVNLPDERKFDGKIYSYRLDMCWWRGEMKFHMRTVKTVQEHRERKLILPTRALPLLRTTQWLKCWRNMMAHRTVPPAAKIPTCILMEVQEIITRRLRNRPYLLIAKRKNVDEQKKMDSFFFFYNLQRRSVNNYWTLQTNTKWNTKQM